MSGGWWKALEAENAAELMAEIEGPHAVITRQIKPRCRR
jgi:hypothetical protein